MIFFVQDATNISQDNIRLIHPVSGTQIQPPAATRFLQFDGISDVDGSEEAFDMDDFEDETNVYVDIETEDDIDFVDFLQVDGAADNDQGTILISTECVFAITAKHTHPLVDRHKIIHKALGLSQIDFNVSHETL